MQLSLFDMEECLEKNIIEPIKEPKLKLNAVVLKIIEPVENKLVFSKSYDSPVFNMQIEVYQVQDFFVNALTYNFKVGTLEGCSWNRAYSIAMNKKFDNFDSCLEHLKDYIKFRMNEILDRSDPIPIQKQEVAKIIMFLSSMEANNEM